ncbi:MAG: cyclopropane fatty acyl phospholipid synthase [Deltaproteobacteria bacterium]|nr:cyclopropane fatty acyl phospholipid synthase [Deltaproteobacteria bacterium]
MPAQASDKACIEQLLDQAGIVVGGDRPWDLRIHHPGFYRRVLTQGALGLGESYMDGWWDCPALDQAIDRILRADLEAKVRGSLTLTWHVWKSRLLNLQSRARAFQVGQHHYDLDNDLYRAMLDERMNYTCGFWRNATTLDEAQEAKLDLVCRKIGLQPGMTILELGCGFGAFSVYAARKYGARVLGVTVSERQVELGTRLCEGLPVELKLADYRTVTGQYDRVVSIGIMEHVGVKNHRTYMEVVDRTLAPGGIAFFHTIGTNRSQSTSNAWTTKYIFPNGVLPSIAQLAKAMEGLFVMEDWHNFGPDYDRTLLAWYANFERAWPELRARYDERFRRMWTFYLLSSAGGFRSRATQLWQVVMTRPGTPQPDCRPS